MSEASAVVEGGEEIGSAKPTQPSESSAVEVVNAANRKPEEAEPKQDEDGSATIGSATIPAPVMVYKSITFIDPLGARWNLPYETAKTWDGLRAFLKRIFYTRVPSWIYDLVDTERVNMGSEGGAFLSMIKIPEEINILPETWEQTVQPGWHVKVEARASSDIIQAVLDERSKESRDAIEKAAKPTITKKKSKIVELYQDITYTAEMYQQDNTSIPTYLRQTIHDKPIFDQIANVTPVKNSILSEVRNVFLNRTKKQNARVEQYTKIESDDKLGSLSLQINSELLLNALKSVMTFQTPGKIESDSGFRVKALPMSDLDSGKFLFPFVDLYHYKDDLLAYKNNFEGAKANHSEEENTECDRHIDVLLKYLYEQPTVALARIEADWTKTVPVTTFDALWLLYKPGSDVFVRERGQLNAYVVESVEGIQRDVSSRIRPLEVELWNIDFNGKTLGRAKKTINVSVFDGHKEIHLLPAFPVRFHRDQENETPLREKLIERGRNFVKFVRQPAHLEYTGPSTFHRLRVFNQARVIVDHTSRPWETELKGEFNRHIPRVNEDDALGKNTRIPECPCTNCVLRKSDAETRSRRLTYDEYDFIPLEQSQDLTDHQYLLCFSHVYAYALIDRLWDLVEVSGLKSPKMDKGVINTLVMRPESNKSMVKAICETYSEKEERESLFFADYIRGKGEGQIILLHGPPGTGKTLTAESVAEYTQRPLLSITASDLGHDPEKLERNLLHFFRNANKWDAIVLLDEADVYLERRSAHDLRRNSIVSVFLRALDYFQGILFLTTNRVGSFDEAFISRIHVQIGYEPLDDSSREQIWMNHFKKLDAHHRHGGRRIEYSLRAKEFAQTSQKLKDLKWNGREIRNAFQTGVTLACYEARQNGEKVPTLTEDHLSQVVAMSTNFKEYMKATLQSDESGLARLYSLRNDESKTSGDTTTTMTTKW